MTGNMKYQAYQTAYFIIGFLIQVKRKLLNNQSPKYYEVLFSDFFFQLGFCFFRRFPFANLDHYFTVFTENRNFDRADSALFEGLGSRLGLPHPYCYCSKSCLPIYYSSRFDEKYCYR